MKEYLYCIRCGRRLKDPISKMLGYGKECYKQKQHKLTKPLFNADRVLNNKNKKEK